MEIFRGVVFCVAIVVIILIGRLIGRYGDDYYWIYHGYWAYALPYRHETVLIKE